MVVGNVFQFSYWQRCPRWRTISQMKNVLLVSKVFCICAGGYAHTIHICDGAFTL